MANRHPVKKFKSQAAALKELEKFIRDGEHLRTGRPFSRFGKARSRELLANWLICSVLNSECGDERFTFTSDPTGGDGIFVDLKCGSTWPSEHVMVPPNEHWASTSLEEEILSKIDKKVGRGGTYASGKTLVVFLEANGGAWQPNRVARRLPDPLYFDTVWVVGLQRIDAGKYVYGVANLELAEGRAPAWSIVVGPTFDDWGVERVQ